MFVPAIFENQQRLSQRALIELAERLELDPGALEQSLRRGEFHGRVQRDFSDGVRSGVNGTPTFFINGRRHYGVYDIDTLTEAVRGAKSRARLTAAARQPTDVVSAGR